MEHQKLPSTLEKVFHKFRSHSFLHLILDYDVCDRSVQAKRKLYVSHLKQPVIVLTTTGLPIICCTDPVMTFTPWPIIHPWLSDLANTGPTHTLSPPAADQVIGGPASSLRGIGGEFTFSTHLSATCTSICSRL